MVVFFLVAAVIVVIAIVIGQSAGFTLRLPTVVRKIFGRH